MATTKDSPVQEGKYKFGYGKTAIFARDKYRNLNLSTKVTTSSSSFSNDGSAFSKTSHGTKSDKFSKHRCEREHDSPTRKDLRGSRKSSLPRSFSPMFVDDFEDKEHSKKSSTNVKNSTSTLSLHIAAYENSMDTVDDAEDGEIVSGEDKERSAKTKTKSKDQDQFVFPRQQLLNDQLKPETMQFTTSKKLFKISEKNPIQYPEPEEDDDYKDLEMKSLQSVVVPVSKRLRSSEVEKWIERKRQIHRKIEDAIETLKMLDQDYQRASELEKRVLKEIQEKIEDRLQIDEKYSADLVKFQKRTLAALDARSEAYANYRNLKSGKDNIRRKLREFHIKK